MAIFKTKMDRESEDFEQNRFEMLNLIDKLRGLEKRASDLSEKRRPRFEERGQLTPRERLSSLLDPGMPFLELYNMASYLVDDPNPETSIPGANMITGIGFVSGVRCLVFIDDSGINAGASTTKSVEKALGVLKIAENQKLPFIHLVESAGANLMNYTVELWAHGGGMFHGLARLSALGIPTITVLHGPSTAGGAYQPGLSDYVIGVKKNGMAALAGAALVHAATGEVSSDDELGGVDMHSKTSGLVEYVAEDDAHGILIARDIIKRLHWNKNISRPLERPFKDPLYSSEDILGLVPVDYKKQYDVREVISRLVDGSDFVDFKPDFGVTTVCIQGEIFGQACGIIANNGPIDPQGANKAAQFFQLCDQSDTPLIFLNNTTGYMVGKVYEEGGMIKHGAKMIQDTDVNDPAVTGFDVEWVALASGNNTEIESWVDDFDVIGTDDYVDGETSYMTTADVEAWAAWVQAGRPDNTTYPTVANGGGAVTAGQPMDDRSAFLESRYAAKQLGATAEWRKLEGISINHKRVEEAIEGTDLIPDEVVKKAYMYMGNADTDNTMVDAEGDIQLSDRVKDCGTVWRAEIESDYSFSRIDPVLTGSTYRSGVTNAERCSVDGLTNPDNVIVLDDGRILIGEDASSNRNNDTLWMYEPADK